MYDEEIMELLLSELRTESRTVSRFAGKHVHFIGIGGCGMSGLARMLLDGGAIVSGSEPKPNLQTVELTQRGAKISRDQLGELLGRGTDLVVRSAAVREENPEMLAARALKIPTIKYAQLLGQVMQERLGVAVAGTHGKSTTTAMIAYALLQCGADASFVVGGTVPQLGGGSGSGSSDIFVAEACEFDRSFHNLHPKIAVITNIEADHLDCYKDIEQIVESFAKFAALTAADGVILANGQDLRVRQALAGQKSRIETVGIGDGFDWSVNETGLEQGRHGGQIMRGGKAAGRLKLAVAGRHNLFNATMAVAACAACGIDPNRAADAVSGFAGVNRRMTEMGKFNGAIVVDDYGHHPTEVRATLAAVREKYRPQRLICVFQPHQHSRTRLLLDEFAQSFADADEIIMPEIYFVRDSEEERRKISAADLVDRVLRAGPHAQFLPKFSSIVDYLKQQARAGDVIVTMGAGNVGEIGKDLVESSVV